MLTIRARRDPTTWSFNRESSGINAPRDRTV